MKKEELIETVKKTITAKSCCKELKDAGEAWLNADDSARSVLGKALLKELREDVCLIDDLISMTTTEKAVGMFGKEACEKMHAAAISAKEKGVRYCLCGACSNGGKILDDPEGL